MLDEHPEVGLVYAQAIKVDERRRPLGRRKPQFRIESYVRSGTDELENLLFYNYITASSALVRRTVLQAVGGFRAYPTSEDWECWVRIARIASIGYLAKPVVGYRIHTNSLTSRTPVETYFHIRRNLLEELFVDKQFAKRYEHLLNPLQISCKTRAASVAYSTGNIKLCRRYAGKALLEATRCGQWAYTREPLWFLSKSILPIALRHQIRRARRRAHIATTAVRLRV